MLGCAVSLRSLPKALCYLAVSVHVPGSQPGHRVLPTMRAGQAQPFGTDKESTTSQAIHHVYLRHCSQKGDEDVPEPEEHADMI